MAQVPGRLPPMEDTRMRLWAPDISLAQPWPLWAFGEPEDGIVCSRLLSVTVCLK